MINYQTGINEKNVDESTNIKLIYVFDKFGR